MARDSIVILGAGIIGLDVALELSRRGYGPMITIVAEHLPGDQSINYTSPWAGGNFSAISGNDANALKWDRAGYLEMWKLVESKSAEARFLAKTKSTEYFDKSPDADKVNSMSTYLKDLVILPSEALPAGVVFGITFTTITINSPAHLQNLSKLLQSPAYGSIPFVQRRIHSLDAAFLSSRTEVVFNCVGNAARTLKGVEDPRVYPTRGQVVLVKAPNVKENIMRHGSDYETYIIPRPNSGGHVILGGYMQKGNSSGDVYDDETESILARTKELFPAVGASTTEVLSVAAGLRPSREGGCRIEAEATSKGKLVVHNYGAGGTGYQAGMGMAITAVDLASESIKQIKAVSLL